MADDTLSPVGFERPQVKAAVPCEDRFALACVLAEYKREDGAYSEQDMIRAAVSAWLDDLGWDQSRRIREHATYRIRCLQLQETNAYGG